MCIRDRRHANGRAIAFEMDSGKEYLFSAKFACPSCSYSLQELEPRIFSFNNPMGACPTCDGLGVIQFFDPKRIVARPDLSLAAGAIRGWDRRNAFYFQMLGSLAAHYAFDVETPFANLPESTQKVLLHGSGRETIPFNSVSYTHLDVYKRQGLIKEHSPVLALQNCAATPGYVP